MAEKDRAARAGRGYPPAMDGDRVRCCEHYILVVHPVLRRRRLYLPRRVIDHLLLFHIDHNYDRQIDNNDDGDQYQHDSGHDVAGKR